MMQRFSFEKLESALSCPWDKLKKKIIKSLLGKFCFVTSHHCFIEDSLFFNVRRPCTNVASCCWSLCSFSVSIWSIIWCLLFLFSLVSFYYYSPSKRHLSLDHSFRYMSEKLRREGLWKVTCWIFAYIPATEEHALRTTWINFIIQILCSTGKSETWKCTCIGACMFAYNQFRLADDTDPLWG